MTLDDDLQSVQEMREAVRAAKEAQHELAGFSQEAVDRVVKAVADAAYAESGRLAELAVEETGMGVQMHKTIKNQVASKDVYESIRDVKTVGQIGEDKSNQVLEFAYPFGVVAAIIPTTNPTSTAIYKTLIAIKGGNSVVVSPHPNARACTVAALKVCLDAAVAAGAPEGLIGWIGNPTMAATTELMHHRDVDLIVATGGGGLVRAAYSSGKPAYGVGPGNVPVYLEKSCDIDKAVRMITDSKTFDNGTICATEQALVVDRNIHQIVVRAFRNQGAYFLNGEEKRLMEDVISPVRGKLNPKIVGQSATTIAQMAGIEVPKETRLLIADEENVGRDVPFSIEKLAPIFPIYVAKDEEDAALRCTELLNLGGRGHSLSLHTKDDQVVRRFGEAMPVSRVLVNTLSSIGAVGATTGLKPSMTLGCGSYGGNITSDNITAGHMINKKRVAYGVKEVTIPKPGLEGDGARADTKEEEADVGAIVREVMKASGSEEKDYAFILRTVKEVLHQSN